MLYSVYEVAPRKILANFIFVMPIKAELYTQDSGFKGPGFNVRCHILDDIACNRYVKREIVSKE